jgi:transmembrane sensor
MDEIIDREQRGEATDVELQQLAEWRRASIANEHEYRRLVRMLSVTRNLVSTLRSGPPTAAELLGRRRDDPRPITSSPRWTPWIVAGAAAAGLIAGFVLPHRGATPPRPSLGVTDVATGAAEMTTIQLGDGSVVRLAPASRLRVTASDSAREVTLDGRAFFVVAKMPSRPFVVHTDAGNARVLGTRFELATHDRDLRLVVVEGRVALSTEQGKVEVRGGEQSGVRNRQTLAPTAVANADRMEQWVGKFLVFQSTSVRDAAREVERMYGLHVVVADSVLSRRTVTATFTDQTAAQVLDVVCSVVNAQCESKPGEVVMSRR